MKNRRIGYDNNLGIPSDFTKAFPCDLVKYDDLAQLIDHFEKKSLEAAFLPVGALPYMKNYSIISQALYSSENLSILTSDFVTTKDINLNNMMNFTLGRVNQFCTTSYWAPLIYLMRLLPQNTRLQFEDASSLHDLLFKTANGVIDGSTLWDILLTQNPEPAAKLKKIFSVTELPTPIIIAQEHWDIEISSQLNQFTSDDKQALFPAFRHPNIRMINHFLSEIDVACDFFNIEINSNF